MVSHHNKSSYHLSAYKVNAILLTVFSVLYFSSPWLTYYATGCLYLLIPFTYSTPHLSPIFTVSYLWQPPDYFLYLRVWVLFVSVSESTCKWNHVVFIFLSVRLSSFSIILLKLHPCCSTWILLSFLWLSSILVCVFFILSHQWTLKFPYVQFSHSVMSDSLRPHGLQHARLPCPSPTPGTCSNSCPSSWWCHPTISSSVIPFSRLQSFPSIRVFSIESVLHIRWPRYWSFSFSISPSNEYSGLISFRTDCFDLLAVQGTLKSLLQHHSSKTSILWCSALFIFQRSHPYVTTGRTIALTRQTFVGKVMSLLFNMLSRLIIAFLPRSKRLLISWLQSPSAVILEPKKTVCHYFQCFPLNLPVGDGTRCHDLLFLNVEF